MTLTAPPIEPQEREGRATLLHFALGYLAGCALYLLVRLLGGLNPDPCRGQTLTALLVPLVLGPGGLGMVASQWHRPPRAIFALGLVVASLFPALFFAARDIAVLRTSGCAGGYVVVSPPTGRGLGEFSLRAGETIPLRVRVGGFNVKTRPDQFTFSAVSTNPLKTPAPPLSVRWPQGTGARLGQQLPMLLTAAPDGPSQQYTLNVTASQFDGRTETTGLTINVKQVR